jgi:nitroimidazol reductase NimA-like FMN-containing flavoprotein (pyridoxamine 5'-phosphate oxidase superfamily)
MGALPVVLPVNYRMVGDHIVFRTAAGTKLEAASSGAVVAFEIDGIDPERHAGWSVHVIGRASVVADPERIAELEAIGIPRWAPAGDERFVAIACELVSGRAVGVP